jgi:hypothetical protein
MPFVHGSQPIFVFPVLLVMARKLSMRYALKALRAARQFPSPDS